jgi:hypothetical protein
MENTNNNPLHKRQVKDKALNSIIKQTNLYKFSGFKAPIQNVDPKRDFTLEEIYKIIVSDKYETVTAQLRNLKIGSEQQAFKGRNLDYVTFSGTFSKRSIESIKQHSNLLCIDLDDLENVNEIKHRVVDALPPSLVFTSPRGKGLKVVYKIAITDANTHLKYFTAFKHFFQSQLDLKIDESCKDVTRACYLNFDNEAKYNNEASILDDSFIDTFCIEDEPSLEEIKESFENIKTKQNQALQYDGTGLKCWDDFNNKNSIIDIISNELEVVRDLKDKYVIKRFGADSSHSGYVYKDNDLMYLFSDNTIYESEKIYTSYSAYCLKHHNNDFSAAAKDIYNKGYGDRITKKTEIVKESKPIPLIPIDTFPSYLQSFINEYIDVYKIPRDYITASVMFSTAFAIGNKLELKSKYDNIPLLWLALVGNVSSGKTDPLKTCLSYFTERDSNSFKDYQLNLNAYNSYEDLNKKDKEANKPVPKPFYFQYLLNDYTPEALYNVHTINERGICIYRDELKGWLDDFGRYSKSGEQSTMLSTFYRQPMQINRASKEPINIDKPTIYVSGGIQPELLKDLAKDRRAENGFLSRIMFAYPDVDVKQHYSSKKLNPETLSNYHKYLKQLANIKETEDLTLSSGAEYIYSNWFNKNVDITNKEPKGYLKGVYGKLDVISLRLAIVVHGMELVCNKINTREISPESMQTAIDLTEYFRATALKVYDKIFSNDIPKLDKKDVAKFCKDLGASQTEISKAIKTSQQYVDKILKE